MRIVSGGWLVSFTRMACCSFGKSQDFSYSNVGGIQKEAKGDLWGYAFFWFHFMSSPQPLSFCWLTFGYLFPKQYEHRYSIIFYTNLLWIAYYNTLSIFYYFWAWLTEILSGDSGTNCLKGQINSSLFLYVWMDYKLHTYGLWMTSFVQKAKSSIPIVAWTLEFWVLAVFIYLVSDGVIVRKKKWERENWKQIKTRWWKSIELS